MARTQLEVDESWGNELWSGIITSYEHAPLKRKLRLHIKTLDNGSESQYRIELKGIIEIHCKSDTNTTYGWDYAELTSSRAELDSNYKAWMEIWSDEVNITCEEIKLERINTPSPSQN